MFVSGLSVSEFALLPDATSIGIVSGSFVSQARERDCPSTTRSMKSLTRSRTRLMQTAYDRMLLQAQKQGATGVIDTQILQHEIAHDLWEYTVQGTAIRLPQPNVGSKPFACTFTGQDYFALTETGYRPLGIVVGLSVYYQKVHQRVQQNIGSRGYRGKLPGNVERSDFTRGFYMARREALAALETDAAALMASGVIGITVTTQRTLHQSFGMSEGIMIEFTAIGTAIVIEHSRLTASPLCYSVPLHQY